MPEKTRGREVAKPVEPKPEVRSGDGVLGKGRTPSPRARERCKPALAVEPRPTMVQHFKSSSLPLPANEKLLL